MEPQSTMMEPQSTMMEPMETNIPPSSNEVTMAPTHEIQMAKQSDKTSSAESEKLEVALAILSLENGVLIPWMVENKFLKKIEQCPKCKGEVFLAPKSNLRDQFAWLCKSEKRCIWSSFVRINSICERAKLSLAQIVGLTYEWASGSKLAEASLRLDISIHTAVTWFTLLKGRFKPEIKDSILKLLLSADEMHIGSNGNTSDYGAFETLITFENNSRQTNGTNTSSDKIGKLGGLVKDKNGKRIEEYTEPLRTPSVDPKELEAARSIDETNGPYAVLVRMQRGVILWMVENHVLHKHEACPTCDSEIKLSVKENLQDGYWWKCQNEEKDCPWTGYVRTLSICDKAKMGLAKIAIICFNWATEIPPKITAEMVTISYPTINMWYKTLRTQASPKVKGCMLRYSKIVESMPDESKTEKFLHEKEGTVFERSTSEKFMDVIIAEIAKKEAYSSVEDSSRPVYRSQAERRTFEEIKKERDPEKIRELLAKQRRREYKREHQSEQRTRMKNVIARRVGRPRTQPQPARKSPGRKPRPILPRLDLSSVGLEAPFVTLHDNMESKPKKFKLTHVQSGPDGSVVMQIEPIGPDISSEGSLDTNSTYHTRDRSKPKPGRMALNSSAAQGVRLLLNQLKKGTRSSLADYFMQQKPNDRCPGCLEPKAAESKESPVETQPQPSPTLVQSTSTSSDAEAVVVEESISMVVEQVNPEVEPSSTSNSDN